VKQCAKCGGIINRRGKKAVLCAQCWNDEGFIAQTVSERGRTGYRPTDTHGMIEDDYSENSRGE